MNRRPPPNDRCIGGPARYRHNVIFKIGPAAADTWGMTARSRRRRMIAATLFLAGAMGVAAAANGHSASDSVPGEIGDAVTVGSAILLSE